MKRNYLAMRIKITAFATAGVIRTSDEAYAKDVVVDNKDFADGIVDGFGGFGS